MVLVICTGNGENGPFDICNQSTNPSEHATSVQRLPKMVQTIRDAWTTLGSRCFAFISCNHATNDFIRLHNGIYRKTSKTETQQYSPIIVIKMENWFCVTCICTIMHSNDADGIGNWLVGCFGFNGPLRQYFSLYRAVSQRKGDKGEKG